MLGEQSLKTPWIMGTLANFSIAPWAGQGQCVPLWHSGCGNAGSPEQNCPEEDTNCQGLNGFRWIRLQVGKRGCPSCMWGQQGKKQRPLTTWTAGKALCWLHCLVLGAECLLWEDNVAINHHCTSSACCCDAAGGTRAPAGLTPSPRYHMIDGSHLFWVSGLIPRSCFPVPLKAQESLFSPLSFKSRALSQGG